MKLSLLTPQSRRCFSAGAALLALLCVSPAFAGGGGTQTRNPIVGQLMSVTGVVTLRRAGQKAPQKALSFTSVRASDTIAVGTGGTATVILFQNGVRYALKSKSAVRVAPAFITRVSGTPPRTLPPLSIHLVRRLTAPPSLSAEAGGITLRGSRIGAGLIPRNLTPFAIARSSGPITLRWEGPDKPTAGMELLLSIADAESGDRALEKTLPATARKFPVPPETLLLPGRRYVWSLTVTGGARGADGGMPRAETTFRVLTDAEQAGVTAMEQAAREMSRVTPRDATPELLMAQNYARVGMIGEAILSYEAALRIAPDEAGRAALTRLRDIARKLR